MAGRGGGRYSQFLTAFNEGYDTVNKVGKDYEMAKIAGEKDTPAFTVAQGAQLDAIANAKDQDGNPYYSVAANPDGTYAVTPNFKNQTGDTPTDYSPATIAAGGATFMGKNYDAPLTDTQRDSARAAAMAGVMEKYGDAEGAMRYRQQAQQGQLTAQQIAQGNTRFGWETADQDQKAKDRQAENDYKAGRQELFKNSPMAQNQAQFDAANQEYQQKLAAYNAAKSAPGMEARDMAELGPAPTAPTMAQPTPGQTLGYYANLIEHDAKYGKVSTEGLLNFQSKVQQLKDEGYGRAMQLAQSGAPLADVAAAFNKQGQAKFDPASVVSDKMAKGPDGVPTRIIQYRDANGNLQTINTLAELNGLGQADKVTSNFFQAEGDRRGNAQLELSRNADTRAQTTFDTEKPVHEANAEIAKLKTRLAQTDDPQEQANLTEKIQALSAGRRGFGAQHDPADVLKAKELAAKGVYGSQAEALDAVVGKPDQQYAEFLKASARNNFGDEVAKVANTMMTSAGWRRTSDGSHWTRIPQAATSAPTGAPAKGTVVDGYEFQGGDPKDQKNWKAK